MSTRAVTDLNLRFIYDLTFIRTKCFCELFYLSDSWSLHKMYEAFLTYSLLISKIHGTLLA